MENCLVKIAYAKIRLIENSSRWQDYMAQSSKKQQLATNRYLKWEDRCRTLFGKMLIKYLLEDYGYKGSLIREIERTEYGRPYLDLPLDFNISHSGDFVICAASQNCRVGIDIEEWNNIDFREFKRIFTQKEWSMMNRTKDTIPAFFNIWAQKESIIKADGRGLSKPLNEIEVNNIKVEDREVMWHLSKLDLFKGYSSWLATNQSNPQIEITEKFL